MGKQKRSRQKYHNAAVKPQNSKSKGKEDEAAMEGLETASISGKSALASNVFKNLKIDKEDLVQKLPNDWDTKSAITSTSLKGLHLKKKDRKKLRHELLVQKLDAVEAARKAAKDKKRKQETPVVGDIGLLGEALPTLDMLLKSDQHKKKECNKEKARSIPKEKRRQKQMMKDIELFGQVYNHPSYTSNPRGTIHEHLQNKLKQENDMDL
ncbi:ribosome biogenesis protein SLX9 homolog [Crassostrea virginica]